MADKYFGDFQEMSPYEAEHYIKELVVFKLEDVGTAKWLEQHERLERLNAQAHLQAKLGSDEFVVDLFATHDKVPLLVYDLILTELWKQKVFPLVKGEVCKQSSVRSYLPLYHEATVINLLEVLFYHKSLAETAGESAIDLTAYCYRKLTYLLDTPRDALCPLVDAKTAAGYSEEKELDRLFVETEFGICMCAIAVTRFLIDHLAALPASVSTTMLNTHDFLLCLAPLLDKQPWCRRNLKGEPQVYEMQQWRTLEGDERLRIPKMHAQVWLAIFGMVMSPECMNRYEMTNFRKDNLLKLRRHLNELVYDQIPPLVELHRILEELSVAGYIPGVTNQPSFILEVVAEMREKLLREYEGRWKELAQYCLEKVFTKESKEDLKRYAQQFLSSIPDLDPKCAQCGKDADQRCSRCKSEWYCSRECQVANWKGHKALCEVLRTNAEQKVKEDREKYGAHKSEEKIHLVGSKKVIDISDAHTRSSKQQSSLIEELH